MAAQRTEPQRKALQGNAPHRVAGHSKAQHRNALEILASTPFRWGLGWDFHLEQCTAPQSRAEQSTAAHSTASQCIAEHSTAGQSNALGFQPPAPYGGLLGGYPPNARQSTAVQFKAQQSNALEILASTPFRWGLGWDFYLMQRTAKQRNALHRTALQSKAEQSNALEILASCVLWAHLGGIST